MKILFILTRSVNPIKGGVQRITYNLGEFFSQEGFQVFFYSLQHDDHIPIAFAQLWHSPTAGGLGNKANLDHFNSTISDIRPDIVINQMPYVKDLAALIFTHKKRYKFVVLSCIHNSLFNYKDNVRDYLTSSILKKAPTSLVNCAVFLLQKLHRIKHKRTLRRMIDFSDLLILYTPKNVDELKYFVGEYKSDRIRYIPNPVREGVLNVLNKEKVILHVGAIKVPQKRSDLLCNFWENVYDRLPDWKFIIVGDGPYLETAKKDFKMRRLDRVEFTGRIVPDSYYQTASIFMMPSAYEGFANTVIEAQYYSCPVLAFDSYLALSWIVNHGKDAVLCKPFDTEQMANEAVALATDFTKLRQMQSASKENASRFTIDKVGQLWIMLFKEITS